MSQVTTYIRNNLPSLSTTSIKETWDRWNINFTTRRELLKLSDSELKDIGLDWVDAEQEGKKKFWQR